MFPMTDMFGKVQALKMKNKNLHPCFSLYQEKNEQGLIVELKVLHFWIVAVKKVRDPE